MAEFVIDQGFALKNLCLETSLLDHNFKEVCERWINYEKGMCPWTSKSICEEPKANNYIHDAV